MSSWSSRVCVHVARPFWPQRRTAGLYNTLVFAQHILCCLQILRRVVYGIYNIFCRSTYIPVLLRWYCRTTSYSLCCPTSAWSVRREPSHAGILILVDHLAQCNFVPCGHLVDFLASLQDTCKMVDGVSLACMVFVFLVEIPCAGFKEGQPARMAILQGTQLYFCLLCDINK